MTNIITPTPDTLIIRSPAYSEVIRIAPDGKLFWRGREIETDADFKAAMLELADYFKGTKTRTRPEALRSDVLEEAADLCDQHLDQFSGTECTYRCDVAQAIRALKRTQSPPSRSLDDGFGNVWNECEREDCALQIVRPGKVQCGLEGCPHDSREPQLHSHQSTKEK